MDKFSAGQAYLDLAGLATYKPKKLLIKGSLVALETGQLAWSEVALAARWKWGRGRVSKFLDSLAELGKIEVSRNNLTTIVTVLEYNLFCGGNHQTTQQIEQQEAQSSEQQTALFPEQQSGEAESAPDQAQTINKKRKRSKPVLPSAHMPTTREEIIEVCQKNDAYRGIDIEREWDKMALYFTGKKVHLSFKRFLNWLNRIEKPVDSGTEPERDDDEFGGMASIG